MDHFNSLVAAISLSMGAAWASGINLYATILMLGILSSTGSIQLPETLQIVSNPWVMGAAGVMFLVEFFADKIPGLDSAWDAVHTFIRIPAGAVLAACAIGNVDPAVAIIAGLIGGGVAASTHAAKAGTRVMVNTSPEPVSNIVTSLGEDALVIAGIWTAVSHPWVFLVLFILFILLLIWLLPKLWRVLKKLIKSIINFFKGGDKSKETEEDLQPKEEAKEE